jgi:Domain of unknown function (DUF4340)
VGWRGTAVLALLVAVAGAYVWFDTTPGDTTGPSAYGDLPPPTPTPPVQPLLDAAPADVIAVRLEHAGRRVAVQRADATWKPVVDDFLQNLTEIGVLMHIAGGDAHLQDYGLAPPQSIVELRFRTQRPPLVLQIGDSNPAATGVYLRFGDRGPVVLAGALLVWEFERAFGALASTPAAG